MVIRLRIDTSAGKYISILEEEREMFDRSFIGRVQEMR